MGESQSHFVKTIHESQSHFVRAILGLGYRQFTPYWSFSELLGRRAQN